MHIQLWPEEIIALNEELATDYHPALVDLLNESGGAATDFPTRFGIIAAYCEVAMDGAYTIEQCVAVASLLVERLKSRRVNPNGVIYVKDL